MLKKKPIILTRGVHPLEISARYLAKKVYEELQKRDQKACLITVPFRTTLLSRALNSSNTWGLTHKELLEEFDFDSDKIFYHDFHNYMLPNDFGTCRSNISIWETTNPQDFKSGHILYDFNYNWFEGDNGKEYELIEGVTYEIPAYFKPLPKRILHRVGNKTTTSSPPQYNNKIVDFRKTKQRGFIDEIIVQLLADTTLSIHKEFPSPVTKLVEEENFL